VTSTTVKFCFIEL